MLVLEKLGFVALVLAVLHAIFYVVLALEVGGIALVIVVMVPLHEDLLVPPDIRLRIFEIDALALVLVVVFLALEERISLDVLPLLLAYIGTLLPALPLIFELLALIVPIDRLEVLLGHAVAEPVEVLVVLLIGFRRHSWAVVAVLQKDALVRRGRAGARAGVPVPALLQRRRKGG